MKSLHVLNTVPDVQERIDLITRDRLDLALQTPESMPKPTLAERRKDPKRGLVWLALQKLASLTGTQPGVPA